MPRKFERNSYDITFPSSNSIFRKIIHPENFYYHSLHRRPVEDYPLETDSNVGYYFSSFHQARDESYRSLRLDSNFLFLELTLDITDLFFLVPETDS